MFDINQVKLFPELIPKTAFGSSCREHCSKEDWDWLRRETYKQANHQCECCGAKGKMEAHEIWHYDDEKFIQKLNSIMCLCHDCHMCFHLGFAEINGEIDKCKKRLSSLNGWTYAETEEIVGIIFEVWYRRSQKLWTLDLSLLDSCGISYKKVSKEDRAKIFNRKKK